MRKRVIAYDLHHKETNDYKDLYELFDQMNGTQLSESVYGIETSLNQDEIEKKLKMCIEKDDIVYFVSVDSDNKLFWKKIK